MESEPYKLETDRQTDTDRQRHTETETQRQKNKALCDSWAPHRAGRTEHGVMQRKYNKVQAGFALETFYSKFSPLKALSRPAGGRDRLDITTTQYKTMQYKTCLDFVIPSLHDTILSPSCTVRCPGVTESLVFLSTHTHTHTYI